MNNEPRAPIWHDNLTRIMNFFPPLAKPEDGLTTVLEWAYQQLPNEGAEGYVMTADDAVVANLWFQAQNGGALAHIALTSATCAKAETDAAARLEQIAGLLGTQNGLLEQQNHLLSQLTEALVSLVERTQGPPPEAESEPSRPEPRPPRRPAPVLVVDNNKPEEEP